MLLHKLRTILGFVPACGAEPQLRTVIDEVASAWPFTEAAVEVSPTTRGVYLLYSKGRLIFIGLAPEGSDIRQELVLHLRGVRGECTRDATAFIYVLTPEPRALYRRYLACNTDV